MGIQLGEETKLWGRIVQENAIYFAVGSSFAGMTEYFIEEENHLSPIVVVSTVVLTATFVVGLLYQLVSLLA